MMWYYEFQMPNYHTNSIQKISLINALKVILSLGKIALTHEYF